MRGLSALVAGLLALGACGDPRDRGGFGEAPPPTTQASPAASPAEAAKPAQLVRVSAPAGFRFEPTSLRIEAGRPARIEFTNRDSQEHTFVISELAVVILSGAGQTVRSDLAVDRSNTGGFEFFCSIGDHRDRGMRGIITVV